MIYIDSFLQLPEIFGVCHALITFDWVATAILSLGTIVLIKNFNYFHHINRCHKNVYTVIPICEKNESFESYLFGANVFTKRVFSVINTFYNPRKCTMIVNAQECYAFEKALLIWALNMWRTKYQGICSI